VVVAGEDLGEVDDDVLVRVHDVGKDN
jgi:hypothetical protein